MTEPLVVDLARDALVMSLKVGGPVLLAAVVVGLVVGLLQAMTQVQDQTISFVPKIAAILLIVLYLLPWMLAQVVEYSTGLISDIPGQL